MIVFSVVIISPAYSGSDFPDLLGGWNKYDCMLHYLLMSISTGIHPVLSWNGILSVRGAWTTSQLTSPGKNDFHVKVVRLQVWDKHLADNQNQFPLFSLSSQMFLFFVDDLVPSPTHFETKKARNR